MKDLHQVVSYIVNMKFLGLGAHDFHVTARMNLAGKKRGGQPYRKDL